ncbi:extracellular solute-binding protein [Microbacterium protaetiae]|uniref:Extracellular solute-binding protein n=1 Tax=Microbacterium protaetiae TaxID=2509458 RepID=A0A4P6EDX9_9MICO|nr:extracellular solute-binding protein [Microbacterium protaetiae]QAY59543.1 extracellular solute-binding protein [Microbacterium protaetiae]
MRFRTVSILAVLGVSALAMSACSSADGGDAGDASSKVGGTLVLYTPNEEEMLDALIPQFEDETGIDVQIVTAGTGELYQRVKSEAANPQGDVVFGGGIAQALANSDLWDEYTSVNDGDMLDAGKNTSGFATPYQADGSNLLVNTEKAKAAGVTIDSYKDLLNPALKGKIAFGDPTQSSSAFAQLTNMLKAVGGDYESDAGWDFVASLVKQLNGITISSSTQVAQSTADGEYVAALTYEPLSLNYVKAGKPVKIVYPSEGAVFLPASAQVIKGAKDQKQAHAFIDYITSEKAQKTIAEETAGRPLREGVDKPGVPALADIKTVEEDSEYVAAHRDDIVARYQQILEAN